LIDSIVYGMLKERPESEKDKHKEIDKLLNNEKKVKALVEGLTHNSEDLREMALGQMKLYRKNNRITKDLIKFLGDNNEAKRNYAATALSLFIPKGDLAARDKLLELLSDNNAKIREKAAYILGNVGDVGDDDIINALLKAVTDSDEAVANAAIDAVCKISNKGDEKVISKMLEQLTKPNTRAAASHGLGVIASKNDQKTISSLLAICNDCDDAAVAVSKLCEEGDATIRKVLIDCLKDINLDDIKLLEALDHCSIKSRSDEVIDTLIEEMKTPKRRIAYRMAYAFGSICSRGDPLAISKLLDCLQDKSLRDKAAAALGLVSDIGNEVVIDQLLTILADKTTHFIVREQAAIALSKVTNKGDKRVITALCERMGDAEEVINACADTLEVISDKDNTQVLDAFLLLTNHPDSGVVERAVQILGRISSRGNQSITDALLAKLKNDTLPETLRSLCAQSLGQVANFNNEQVLEILTGFALKEESSYVRRYCIDAIGVLVDNRENEKITTEIFNMLKTEEANSPIVEHGVATLAKICNIATMIDQLKSKTFRNMRPIIFDIVVKAIRILRNANPNWKLDQAQIEVLSQFKSLESTFILLENAG
jgi:HEAT repeat protein